MNRGSVKKWLLALGAVTLGAAGAIAWYLLTPPAVPPGFAVGNEMQNQEAQQKQTQAQIHSQQRQIEQQRQQIQQLKQQQETE